MKKAHQYLILTVMLIITTGSHLVGKTSDSVTRINPLPEWWQEVLDATHTQLLEGQELCRICVQIHADKEGQNSPEWKHIVEQGQAINSFIEHEHRFSRAPLQDICDLLMAIAYEEIEAGLYKGVTCKSSIKVVKASGIQDAHDEDVKPTAITLALFVLFDAKDAFFNSFFYERPATAIQALDLYFDASNAAYSKGLKKNCSVDFYACIQQ
jgi:hypothetical protein